MVLIDNSAWIDHLRERRTREAEVLRNLDGDDAFCTGNVILLELL